MNDTEKWLEAAAGIEQDILYLKEAARAYEIPHEIEKEVERLKIALAVYQKNASAGVPWPSPDDLYCIQAVSCSPLQVATGMRRDFKLAS